MTETMSRRRILVAAPTAAGAALGTLLLDPSPAAALAEKRTADPSLHAEYPTQEPAAVREVVAVSHGNFTRVRDLVDARPELAKAAWDWGFGDWETALGAASHTGNREIAEYLIRQGARPDLFTAAMIGNLAAVEAFVAASPGMERLPGPHGITLLAHARAGGERAVRVLRYLESLGDADVGPTNLPLEVGREAFLGTYAFGPAGEDRFEISLHRSGLLMIQRADGTPRTLFHQGGGVFHPAGAPSARVQFSGEGERIRTLEIRNPELLVTARRVG